MLQNSIATLARRLGRRVPDQLCSLSSFTQTLTQCRLLSTETSSEKRNIFAACVLERLPVVMPDDPPWELEYDALRQHLFARHRRPVPDEFAQLRGTEADAADSGQSGFAPAPRVTEADEAGDVKSLRRTLDKRLFLLIKTSGASGEGMWRFPHAQHREGETIRQTAERALAETLTEDPDRQVYFVGNSPAGHGEEEEGTLFFHRAQLIKGGVAVRPQGGRVADHAWVTKAELGQYVADENASMLFDLMLSK